MNSYKLISDIFYTYCDKAIMKNIVSAVELCHLSVEKFIITPQASGASTMVRDERKNGAVIIDLGEDITSIGVFINDEIIFSDSIPVGGVHITSDIVRGLGAKSEDTEKKKNTYERLSKPKHFFYHSFNRQSEP